jgi:hypothetical protein
MKSVQTNGNQSMPTGTGVVTASNPSTITTTILDSIEREQWKLTAEKHNEHYAMEMALRSLCEKSVQRGHNNDVIYTDIHHIINALSAQNLLPNECYLGRMAFCGIKRFTRAAIDCDMLYITDSQEDIKQWCLDHWLCPEEILKVLTFSSANASSNGMVHTYSNTLRRSFKILNALPVSVRSGVLQSKYNSVNLFSAV